MFAVDVNALEQSNDTITVHFNNTYSWDDVYIYFYDTNVPGASWPGVLMNKEDDDWYSYSFENTETATVVFTNGCGHQIPARSQPGLLIENNCCIVNDTTYQSMPSAEVINQSKTEPDITVHFYNSENWDNVFIYQYTDSYIGKTFPGTKMTAEGDGWYKYEIYGYSEIKVIINNGLTDKDRSQYPYIDEDGFLVSGERWITKLQINEQKPDGIKVHYYNSYNWDTPYLYYYSTGGKKDFSFPGIEMKNDGHGWYSYTVYGYEQIYAITNNSKGQQIPSVSSSGFNLSGESWIVNGELLNQEPTNVIDKEPITVYFYNKDNWDNVYVYYYDNSNMN